MSKAILFTVPYSGSNVQYAYTPSNVPAYSGAWCVELDFQLNSYDTSGAAVFFHIVRGLMLSFQQSPAVTYIYDYPSINAGFSWAPTLGVPYHIAIYDTGTVRGMYVWNSSGTLVYSNSLPGNITLVAPGYYKLYIGISTYAPGTAFLGWVQDMRVWYAVPSQATLQSWAYTYVDASHPNYSSLRINYRTNEGTGTTLADSGSLNLPATLYGSPTLPTWVDGLGIYSPLPPGASGGGQFGASLSSRLAGPRSSGGARSSVYTGARAGGSGPLHAQRIGGQGGMVARARSLSGMPFRAGAPGTLRPLPVNIDFEHDNINIDFEHDSRSIDFETE